MLALLLLQHRRLRSINGGDSERTLEEHRWRDYRASGRQPWEAFTAGRTGRSAKLVAPACI
jgi:hypothetical protein